MAQNNKKISYRLDADTMQMIKAYGGVAKALEVTQKAYKEARIEAGKYRTITREINSLKDKKTELSGIEKQKKALTKEIKELKKTQTEIKSKSLKVQGPLMQGKEDKQREEFQKTELTAEKKRSTILAQLDKRMTKNIETAHKLNKKREDALKSTHRLSKALKEQGVNTRYLSRETDLAAVRTKRLADEQEAAKKSASSLQRRSEQLAFNKKRFDKFSRRAAEVSLYGQSIQQTAARISEPLKAGREVAQDFEFSMSQIEAKLYAERVKEGKISPQERKMHMKDLRARIMGIAEQRRLRLPEVGEAARAFAQAGESKTKIIENLPTALSLAVAENMTPQDAAEAVISQAKMFGLKKYSESADAISYTASSTSTDALEVMAAMRNVGAVASTLGVTLSETMAMINIAAKAKLVGEESGTGIRNVISGLYDPNNVYMRDILKIKRDNGKGLRPIFEILKEVSEKTRGWSKDELVLLGKTIGGQRASAETAFAQLMRNIKEKGKIEIDGKEIEKSLLEIEIIKTGKSKGFTSTVTNIMEDNTRSAEGRFQSSIDNLAVTLNEDVLRAFEGFYDGSAKIINKLNSLLKESPTLSSGAGLAGMVGEKAAQGIGIASEIAPTALVGFEALKYYRRKKELEKASDAVNLSTTAIKGTGKLGKLGKFAKVGGKFFGGLTGLLAIAEIGWDLEEAYENNKIEKFSERLKNLDTKKREETQRKIVEEKKYQENKKQFNIDARATLNIYSQTDLFKPEDVGKAIKLQVEDAIKEAYLYDE